MPTTSVSASIFSSISAAERLFDESCRISEWETIWLSEKRESNSGLKTCTFCRAIFARRKRRISSSDFPENIDPAITSTQPAFARECGGGSSWFTCVTSSSILVQELPQKTQKQSGVLIQPGVVKRCKRRDERQFKTHRARDQVA